jgi:hypothetical protein
VRAARPPRASPFSDIGNLRAGRSGGVNPPGLVGGGAPRGGGAGPALPWERLD